MIPPVTTNEIEVFAYKVTDTTEPSITFTVMSSILPPPFTITDDPDPLSQQGVMHPPITRTITPPPYPYFTTSGGDDQSTKISSAESFPTVTYKSGPPGPPCKLLCGKPCVVFCGGPCLIDCTDAGDDFPDPIDPPPPPATAPGPQTTAGPDSGPNEDDPQDEEEEELDDDCDIEFGLPQVTLIDGDGDGGDSSSLSLSSATTTVSASVTQSSLT